MPSLRTLVRGSSVGFALALVSACASPTIEPPSADLRARMAKIEIHVSSPANQVNRSDETPAAGAAEGASYSAKVGARGAIIGGMYVGAAAGCHKDWNGLILITCPVGLGSQLSVVAGAGFVQGRTKSELRKAVWRW